MCVHGLDQTFFWRLDTWIATWAYIPGSLTLCILVASEGNSAVTVSIDQDADGELVVDDL